ncbi:hypothetical protein GN244_ATG06545 [Phytophthora infestans]|uniref:Uncharacterized protein n=1 Tax=Phytophthora infestans TaxID=4787 RepID=A0A833SZX3_PHYIN|nr:hypothetical protein GN244_ATG06545 [Phytophthora infestans]
MALALISSSGIQAQDVGTVSAAVNPEVTAAAVDTAAPVDPMTPMATEPAAPIVTTSATPVATEAPATPPVATEAATVPVATEAPTTSPPESTPAPVATEAAIVTTAPVAVSTDPPTTSTPTAPPSTAQVASESMGPNLQDTTSPQNLRGSGDGSNMSASSQSSSSKSVSDHTTGTLDGLSSTKLTVMCLLGGVGIAIIMSLLFVVRRTRRRDDPELGTPIGPDTAEITSPPATAITSNADVWKAKGASFASQNLPPAANTRAKMNATTRSSAEFDMANRVSQIASLPAPSRSTKPQQPNRDTNLSPERSLSFRGCSEFSLHHEGDSEASFTTNERYSTNDGYSTSDRYSMSSRLSSEVGRSNSGWFQRQAPKNLDMPRASSTSSTASSVAARKHSKVSFVTPAPIQTTPSTEAPVTTKSSISRTDVPDWYRVIESPSDNDRYTTSSLDSDNISSERESFEL